MSGDSSTEQPPGPPPPRRLLKSSEIVIYERMQWLDRKQGCHAAIDTIRKPGEKRRGRDRSYSTSHTRRLVRGLRESGWIVFAGQTADGRNIYLFPEKVFPSEGEGKKYKASDLPICASRPVDHLFPTDAAQALIEEGSLPKPVGFLVEGFRVCRKVAADYSEEVLHEAIRIILATYTDPKTQIRYPAGLLRSICEKVVDRRSPKAAERRSEAKREASQRRFEEQSPEHRAQLAALLARGQRSSQEGPVKRPAEEPAVEAVSESKPGTLGAFLDDWLRWYSPQISKETQGQYQEKLARIKDHLGDIPPRELRRGHFVDYVQARRDDGVKEQTINAELSRLKQALREAEKRGVCKASVREAIPRLKTIEMRQARPLTEEDYQKLRAALRKHPKRQAYLDLGVYTGARRSELEGLEKADVDLKRGRIHIRGTKTKGSDRYVPLRPELAELVRKHPGGKLVGLWRNAPGDLAEACEAAGIERRTVLDLRHTFASWLKQRGVDSLTVAKLMGHRDGKMVEQVYAHLDDATLRRAMEQLPARAGPEARPPPSPGPSDPHPSL